MALTIETAPVYGTEMGEEGPYTVEKVVVQAVTDRGEVFQHFKVFDRRDDAEKLADRIRKSAPAGWSPVDNDHWRFERNVYGSEAYGRDDEHYAQRLDVENEYGAGSYHSNHHGYLKGL